MSRRTRLKFEVTDPKRFALVIIAAAVIMIVIIVALQSGAPR